MTETKRSSSVWLKIFSLSGVTIFCYLVSQFSAIHFFEQFIPSLKSSQLFSQFEQHLWQFLFAFLAIGLLSRGHLWSYGITSKNLKTSMYWLGFLYAGTILLATFFWLAGLPLSPLIADFSQHPMRKMVLAMLTYWLSSPVANQLLFFGLTQTVLMKQWGDEVKVFGVPVPVIVSVILFGLWSSASSFMIGSSSIVFTSLLGIFCGIVYWKTGSLITPMLGHAFYFGFPLIVHILGMHAL